MSARVVVSLCDLPGHEETDGETDDDREKADEDGGNRQRLSRVESGGTLCGGHGPVLVVRDVVLLNDDVNVEQLVKHLLLRGLRRLRPLLVNLLRPLLRCGRGLLRLGSERRLEAGGAGGVFSVVDVLDEGGGVESLSVDKAMIDAGVRLEVPRAIWILEGDAPRACLHLHGVAAVERERFHLKYNVFIWSLESPRSPLRTEFFRSHLVIGEDDEAGLVVHLLHLDDLQVCHRHVVGEDLDLLNHDRLRGVAGV